MNYPDALSYVHSLYRFGSRLGLERIRTLLEMAGNPHQDMKFVHVAGTNGKGSTVAMIASILRSAGLRVGCFISPYLERFTERIVVSGREIPEEAVADLVSRLRPLAERMGREGEHPTEFEFVTAMGFLYFKEQQVDVVCLEVGLGGRFDATNAIERPLVSVITSVGFDHTDRLGDTLEQIAFEKAGIIKPGCPVVSAPQPQAALAVLREVAAKRGSPLTLVGEDVRWTIVSHSWKGLVIDVAIDGRRYEDLYVRLPGAHQAVNATAAVAALEVLRERGLTVGPEHIRRGLREVKWPGRLEVLSRQPYIVLDGAHNQDGARALAAALRELFPGRRVTLVLGLLRDRPALRFLRYVQPVVDELIVTKPLSPRALDPEVLAVHAGGLGLSVQVVPDLRKALLRARSLCEPSGVLCVSGSLYLVGPARTILRELGVFHE